MAAPSPQPPNRKPSAGARCRAPPAGTSGAGCASVAGPGTRGRPSAAALRGGAGRALVRASPVVSAAMTDTPWLGDTCSLVDAFRAGERSPRRGARGDARGHRGERAQRLLARRRRAGPRRGRVGRRVAAVRRRADRHEGARPGRGLAGHRGVAGVHGPPAPTYTATHDRSASGRRGGRRSGRPPPASSAGSTSASPSSTASPTTRGSRAAPPAGRRRAARRGGGRRASSRIAIGRRRRRVDPHPRRVQRAARHEGHGRSHPPRAPHRHPPDDGRARLPWRARSATSARWYDVAAGYDIPRPVLAAAGRGLGARPRHPRPAGPAGGRIAPDARRRRRPPRGRGAGPGGGRAAGPRRRASSSSTCPSRCPGSASSGPSATWPGCAGELGDRWPDCQRRPHAPRSPSASTSPRST